LTGCTIREKRALNNPTPILTKKSESGRMTKRSYRNNIKTNLRESTTPNKTPLQERLNKTWWPFLSGNLSMTPMPSCRFRSRSLAVSLALLGVERSPKISSSRPNQKPVEVTPKLRNSIWLPTIWPTVRRALEPKTFLRHSWRWLLFRKLQSMIESTRKQTKESHEIGKV
jgi:hypothetical protein